MDRELFERIRTAGIYQKKAIQALFPKKMNRHMEIIEKEIKAMMIETVTDWMKECKKDSDFVQEEDQKQNGNVKKVDIM